MNISYKKVCTKAGRSLLTEIRAVTHSGRGEQRQPRSKPTPQAMAAYNEKMAKRKLRLLLNENFSSEDYHLTLTYAGQAPDRTEAKARLRSFLGKAARRAKAAGKELLYIAVTEWQGHRIHHHLVLSGLSSREASSLWSWGRPHCTYLDASGDYGDLASYLIKETKESLRQGLIGRRWSASRNLRQPKVTETPLKRGRRLEEAPRPIKHYRLVDWETYANPVNGTLIQSAFYLRLDEPKQKRKRE